MALMKISRKRRRRDQSPYDSGAVMRPERALSPSSVVACRRRVDTQARRHLVRMSSRHRPSYSSAQRRRTIAVHDFEGAIGKPLNKVLPRVTFIITTEIALGRSPIITGVLVDRNAAEQIELATTSK